jgi:hypothetical protein
LASFIVLFDEFVTSESTQPAEPVVLWQRGHREDNKTQQNGNQSSGRPEVLVQRLAQLKARAP